MARQKKEEAIPAKCLREVLRVGQIIVGSNAGKPIDKLTLSEGLGYSPKASGFMQLLASSNLYGLTKYEEGKVALTDLGQSYFYPQSAEERKGKFYRLLKRHLFFLNYITILITISFRIRIWLRTF